MKKILFHTILFCSVAVLGGCSDFFEVNPDNTLDDKDYISEESELYTGFMGIITKMQAIGDKVIYLNEMRGEMMEPTSSAPRELYSLYHYDDDLSGNSYADPSGFYEVVNACNDYLAKLSAYKAAYSVDQTTYRALISSALRIKVWTYMTLAKTYGSVVWTDEPVTSVGDLSRFTPLDLDQTMAKCRELLDKGFDGVDGTYSTTWYQWLDPDGEEATSPYRYWDLMTPPYYAVYGELCLWLGDYQGCIDVIQGEMNSRYRRTNAQNIIFLRNDASLSGSFNRYWNAENPYAYEAASAIMYNAANHQTNRLLSHFDSDYPNHYWIAPSEAGRNHFSDLAFNPLGTRAEDFRTGYTFRQHNGQWVFCKYRLPSDAVREAYEDDVFIYTYRGADLYFMLAEAFNELGEVEPVDALINQGVQPGNFDSDEDGNLLGEWYGFLPHWTNGATTYYFDNGTVDIGSRRYGDRGIRGGGYINMASRTFVEGATVQNAEEIMKEMMLEMAGEGKVYPALIRMVRRHGNASFMADVISEKYQASGRAQAIRNKLLNGDYFVPWDLGK